MEAGTNGSGSGQTAFAFLASTEGPFDDPADFFPRLPLALLVRIVARHLAFVFLLDLDP
jgi:hypothetical protein